jgi:hypothetical protein
MKSLLNTIQLVCLSLIFSGCASTLTSPIYLPDPSKGPTASLSTESISTWTETVAEDHLIPNSQVLIGGQGVTGPFLGLLGVMIDRSKNSSTLEGEGKSLGLTFHEVADGILKNTLTSVIGADGQYRAIDSRADVKLRAVARFTVAADKTARMSMTLLASFVDAKTNTETKRAYGAGSILKLPLTGGEGSWAFNDAAKFREESALALKSVMYAFVRDLSGAYKYNAEGKPVVTIIRTRPSPLGLTLRTSPEAPSEMRIFLLEEWQQKLIVFPNFKDSPLPRFISIFPRELVERVD